MVPVTYEALDVDDDILATLPEQLPSHVLGQRLTLRTEVHVEGLSPESKHVIHLVIAPIYDVRTSQTIVVVARDPRRIDQEDVKP